MFGDTPVVKKSAHENLTDAIERLKFPGRLTDVERDELLDVLAIHCVARKNDVIPTELLDEICSKLLYVAMSTGTVIPDEIWSFVVSQMDGEELAIVLLDEICVGLEEGWVIAEHPSGTHIAMTTALYDETVGRAHKEANEVLGGPGSPLGGLFGNLLGHLGIGGRQELLPDPIIARVGPQPEVEEETSSACGCVCAECEARAAGCPIPEAIREAGGCGREVAGAGLPEDEEMPDMMDTAEGRVATGDPEPTQDSGQIETAEAEEPPIPEASETPAEVEEPLVAETDDTPAEEEAVPAASD